MTIRERIMLCRLIEKVDKNEVYSKNIGITNESKFKGKSNRELAAKYKKNK